MLNCTVNFLLKAVGFATDKSGSNSSSFALFLLSFLSLSASVVDGSGWKVPSDRSQKILFVVPVPQCESSLFESGLSIRAVQRVPLQCRKGRRQRFKLRRKKKPKRNRGEERGAVKVREKKG